MDTDQPYGGDPQDYMGTQEIGPAGTQHWGQGTPKPPRRRGRGLRWGAGLALAAVLAGGGVYALASRAPGAPAGPTGQAAQLNSILNSASSPDAAAAANAFAQTMAASKADGQCAQRAAKLKAAGHPNAAERARLFCRSRLARLRLVGGIHGELTFRTKTGTATLAYERGVIQSVSASEIVVRASDGTTWTWALESSTVVRQAGKKTGTSALASGERVFAGGPVVSSGTYRARLIVIQPASAASPAPSPSPSPAAGASAASPAPSPLPSPAAGS